MTNRSAMALGVLMVVALVVAMVFQQKRANRPPEDPGLGRREARAAFEAPKLHEGALPPGIPALFKDLGDEFRDRKGADAIRFFDMERMLDDIDAEGMLRRSEREGFIRGAKVGMGNKLAEMSDIFQWDRTEVRHLRWYLEGRDAVVITRHSASDDEAGDISFKMRWWLILRDGQWRIYDIEDMSIGGGRVTVLMGSLLKRFYSGKGRPDDLNQIAAISERMGKAREAIVTGDFAEAEKVLDRPVHVDFSEKLNAILLFWKALAKINLGKNDEGLAVLDQAERLDRGMPGLNLFRSIALNNLERHEEAIASAQKYLDELGPDDTAYFQLARAQFALNRPDEARDSYRKGFDETPNSPDWIESFRETLDPNQKKELGERFAKLSKPERHFTRLFWNAFLDNDQESARELITAFRKLAPNDPQGPIRDGQLLLKQDRIEEAGKRFLEALALPAPKENDSTSEVLRDCVDLYADKQGEKEAYDLFAARDRRKVFRVLLERILDEEFNDDEEAPKRPPVAERLESLIALHRENDTTDPWLGYATGELHEQRKDYEAAEKAFAETFERVKTDEDKTQVRSRRVHVLCELGRGVMAYEKIDPTPETFDRVGFHLTRLNRGDDLARLIELRSKKEPDAVELHFWRGELAWLKKEYPEAAKHYRRMRDADEQKYTWMVGDRLIRSLLRSKQYEAARREIQIGEKEEHPRIYRAALAAHEGDARKLGEEFDRLKGIGFNEWGFHSDEDVGPRLREKPEFRHLLEKFPVPKDFVKPGKEL